MFPRSSRWYALVILAALAVAGPAEPVWADSSIVISQLYGGGGNSGATYKHDFIEIFNRGSAPVSLSGWSLQYTSATSSILFGAGPAYLTPLNGTLNPGHYFLIQEAQGAGGSVDLPTPDITDSTPIALSGTGGKVALVSSTTPLGGNGSSTPIPAANLPLIVDLVGWGGANYFEGSGAAPATTNTTALFRQNGGRLDTNNNATDFLTGPPAPRHNSTPITPTPLPSAALLFASGIVGLMGWRKIKIF